jgi:RHS repeat-associated protein
MPDGSTWYQWHQRNFFGHTTNLIERWLDTAQTERFRTNRFLYSTDGLDLIAHLGPDGALVSGYAYDSNHPHLPVAITNALAEVTRYFYDTAQNGQRLLGTAHPSGLASTNYYSGNWLAATVDLLGATSLRTNSYTWQDGRIRTHTDPRGLTLTFSSDSLGRLTRIDYPDSSYIQHAYTNGAGTMLLDRTATRDRLGNWTRSEYNGLRQVTRVLDPLLRETRYTYCGCGGPETVTRAYGTSEAETTQYEYDYQGNRTVLWFPDATAQTNTFDALRRLTATSDALGTTAYAYNNLGLVTAVSNAVGQVSLTLYDLEDRPWVVTDANGVTVTNTYDALGRLTGRTYPDGGIEAFGYTANVAAMTSSTNQITNVVFYTYDAAGRKTRETYGTSLSGSFSPVMTNSFTYAPAGDLLTLTDGKGQVTTWSYDTEGRVNYKWDAKGTNILAYLYDAGGRLTNRWSRAKGNTRYLYDPVSNLTNVDYPASTDLRFKYDALNRLTNMVDAAGTTVYSYTSSGLASEDGPWSSDTVNYSCHPLVHGLVTNVSVAQPSTTNVYSITYGYDAAHRLSTVSSTAGNFTYTYRNAGSQWTNLALPSSSVITNGFDGLARLANTTLRQSGGTVLDRYAYAYNLASQRTRMTRTDGSYVDYTYDPLGEVTKALGSGGESTENLGYKYDPAWNLNARTNSGYTTAFNVDVLNQLTTVSNLSCTYDANGNLTARVYDGNGPKNYYYTYDDENQLTSAATDSYYTYSSARWKSEYTYDGRQRLRKRVDYTWNTQYSQWQVSAETRFLYMGNLVIQERNSSNTPTVSYVRGNDLSGTREGAGGIGGLLARSDQYSAAAWGRHVFYHADGNGNITYLVDASQALAAKYRYDPFGNTTHNSGTLASANAYRFSSKAVQPSSGLYYYGYRFDDPYLQRWLSRDPLGEQGGHNLYGFVSNNPVSKSDASGLAADESNPLDFIANFYGLGQAISHLFDNDATTFWEAPACPEGEETRFIQVVIGRSLSTFGRQAVVDDGSLGLGSSLYYPHTGASSFADTPSWHTRIWPKPLFETCRVCLCNGQISSAGPCKTWQCGGQDQNLGGPGYPTSKWPSLMFIDAVRRYDPKVRLPILVPDPVPNA